MRDLIGAIVRRGVYVMPNLSGAERGTHSTAPAWFEEPGLMALFRESTPRLSSIASARRSHRAMRPPQAPLERVRNSSAESCRAQQGWRADHSWMRHRVGGSSLRLRGTARARRDGGGGHVAGSGDCRRHEPFGRVSRPSDHGDSGGGQARRLHRPSRKPPRRHKADTEHRIRVASTDVPSTVPVAQAIDAGMMHARRARQVDTANQPRARTAISGQALGWLFRGLWHSRIPHPRRRGIGIRVRAVIPDAESVLVYEPERLLKESRRR